MLEDSYRSILKVALPIMLGSFVQFIVTFTDTAFMGRLGEYALNAVGNAGLIYMTMVVVSQGISSSLQIIVARRKGQKKFHQIGPLLFHGMVLLAAWAIVLTAVIRLFSSYGMTTVIADQTLAANMSTYLDIRSWGYIFTLLQLGIAGYFLGIARSNILTYSMIITAGLNICFDYVLVFGKFGFPEMGIAGAAYASLIAEIGSLVYCLLYLIYDKENRTNRVKWLKRIRKVYFKKLLKVASPLMAQGFISMIGWTIFFMLIEKIGQHELAVSQIIRSLYFLGFIPILGFGIATRTFVSNYMAENDTIRIKRIMKKMVIISAIGTFLCAHGYILYPELIIGIITDNQSIIQDTIPVLYLVVASMFVFSASSVFYNAVSGVGNTRITLQIEIISIVLYLSLAFYVTVVNPQPLINIWALEFLYFGCIGLFSVIYFKFFDWKKYNV